MINIITVHNNHTLQPIAAYPFTVCESEASITSGKVMSNIRLWNTEMDNTVMVRSERLFCMQNSFRIDCICLISVAL